MELVGVNDGSPASLEIGLGFADPRPNLGGSLRILSPSGLLLAEQPFPVRPRSARAQGLHHHNYRFTFPLAGLPIPEAGLYRFEITCGGEVLGVGILDVALGPSARA